MPNHSTHPALRKALRLNWCFYHSLWARDLWRRGPEWWGKRPHAAWNRPWWRPHCSSWRAYRASWWVQLQERSNTEDQACLIQNLLWEWKWRAQGKREIGSRPRGVAGLGWDSRDLSQCGSRWTLQRQHEVGEPRALWEIWSWKRLDLPHWKSLDLISFQLVRAAYFSLKMLSNLIPHY